MSDLLVKTRLAALRVLAPPPRLPLSQWIEEHMRLPEGVSALPGRVKLWPYQRDIADAITEPAIERVTIVKPVRVGFTTLLTGALGSYIANEPSPSLIGVASESVLSGEDFDLVTRGVFTLPKVAALAIAIGDKVYWDSGTKLVTKTAAGNTLLGVAVTVAANPSGSVDVRLNGSF